MYQASHEYLCYKQYVSLLGLKRIVVLVFEYSFSFQTNSPNILLNIRSSKMIVFSDKMMLISVD